jgi:hypothetical protein
VTAPRLSGGGIIAGKYTVRSMMGNGGAVITYQCVSQSGQEVAVKLYDPAVASHATVMKSLEQAYAATNALPAGSSAPIIDAGYDQPTLAPFSVTEVLRLPSVQAQQRRFSPEEVVTLLKGLARSLDLAHVRQVVHGAIKPTNVFVGPSMNPVVVTDFAANLPKAAAPTQEGYVGSAPWIAPEQAQSGSVTPAADVFSVGLLAFYALTGRSYWRSCQQSAVVPGGQPQFDLAGWQQELGAVRVPPSLRAAELGVPLSPTLDIALCKALASDPNERFRSIGEFASEMENALTKQQVGSAATMALPMIGEPPSPLPSNMKNPERGPAPLPVTTTGATMALPLEAILPGGFPPQMGDPMGGQQQYGGQQQMGGQQYGGPQAGAQYGGPQTGGQQQMGYGGMPAPAASQPGMGGGWGADQGMSGYGQGRDQGYPPPPQPNGMAAPQTPAPHKSSKIVPVVIGFTAVALLGVIATVFVLKWKDSTRPADQGPPVVPTASATSTATGDTAAPPATTPPVASASSSAAAGAKKVGVKIICVPGCDEIKVAGEKIDPKTLELAPGSYDIEVSKAGYESQDGKLEIKDGSPTVTKTFTLKAEQASNPTPTATAQHTATAPTATSTGSKGGNTGGKTGGKNCKKVGFITKCT